MTIETASETAAPALFALEDSELAQSATAHALLDLQGALVTLAGGTVSEPLTHRLPALEAILAKVNKRAAKLGAEPVRLAVLGTKVQPRLKGGPIVRTVIALFGLAPKVAGHSLVARIEHTPAGNITARCPVGAADVDLTKYYNASPVCAHCGTERARKDTFLVRKDETGEIFQIGRNCLADFIRSTDVENALRLWKFLSSLVVTDGEEEEGSSGGSWHSDPSVIEYLSYAVSAVATDGFRKSNVPNSTKDHISFLMGTPPNRETHFDTYQMWAAGQPTNAHFVRAETILAWCLTQNDSNDYLRNLRISCSLPNVGKHAGLLASAPVAYARHIEGVVKKTREVAKPTAPKGVHVGVVGQRLELGDLTVMRVRYYETDFGTKTILALETAEGNALTWFASGARDFTAGDVMKSARATVKKHDEYQGRPQTVVSRLAFVEEKKEEAS
jgi:hypothetical protein